MFGKFSFLVALRRHLPSFLLLAAAIPAAAEPAWWAARGVKNNSAASNLSPATIGQAKHMAAMALAELQPKVSSQDYQALQTDVAAFVNLAVPQTPPEYENQKMVLVSGQLKALSKPFYDHLRSLNPAWMDAEMTVANIRVAEPGSNPVNYRPYPWSVTASVDSNKSPATVGQLKAVFALRLEAFTPLDFDHDDLLDTWELSYFPDLVQTATNDPDGYGLTNAQELAFGFNPSVSDAMTDSDGDGLLDVWELHFFPNLAQTATGDPDGDGLTNAQELAFGFNPCVPDATTDSDGDGLLDTWELSYFSDLVQTATNDPDGDGLTNAQEQLMGFDPTISNASSESGRDGIYWQKQGKRNVLTQGLHVPLAAGRPERNEGNYYYTNEGYYGEIREITAATQLLPGYLTSEVVKNSWKNDLPGSFSNFWVSPQLGYTNYSGEIRVHRRCMVVLQPAEADITRNYLKILSRSDTSYGGEAVEIELKQFKIPADGVSSNWIELIPPVVAGWQYNLDLIPLEAAPEVLAVNSNFDEGRVDPATGYAIPDCDDADIALEAVRDHLDGKYQLNERITDDMHPGFFGVNPSNLGNDFWAGAEVTIRKLDKDDPDTPGHKESGQVRFYAKWGDGPSEYRAIVPYDFESLAPVNLASGGINRAPEESVYGATSPFPAGTSYFIEGVHPGWITLEWRYQKDGIDIKYEQRFEVCTHKSASQWKNELAYKIRLETSNDPSGQINVEVINHPTESYQTRMERMSEYYDYYQDSFVSPLRSKPLHSQAISWPGLARLAGSQVVAGLSDAEYARRIAAGGSAVVTQLDPLGLIPFDFTTWSASELADLEQALFTGGRDIFKSIGWQMHAYRSSGYRALDWVAAETGEAEVSAMVTANVWKDLRTGVLSNSKTVLNEVASKITEREQNVTIVPTWGVISGLFHGTTDLMFTILGKNSCTPSGLDFTDIFPISYVIIPPSTVGVPVMTGSLANTANRWDWINPGTTDGILDTWNKHPEPDREALVRRTLGQDARRFSLISHFPHSLPMPDPGLPVYVWDNEDVP